MTALPQNIPRNLVDLSAQSNDPWAQLRVSGQQAQGVADAAPAQKFGFAIMDLLKRYQTLGTRPFVQQGLDAQQAQNNAIMAPTPQSLIGASPNQQDSVRNAQAQAYNPTIQGARQSAQTFGEQLNSFGDVVKSVQTLMKNQEDTLNQQRDDARSVVNQILTTTDPSSLHGLNRDDLATLEKQAGYPKGFLDSAITYKHQQAIIAARKASGEGGPTTTTPQSIVDPKTDATVQALIASNPNEWGHAAEAIDKQFGAGTATKYDSWLKAVYQNGQNINDVAQPVQVGNYSPLTGSRYALQATRIAKNFIDLPIYQATANGQVYLSRIAAASQNPGSVGDAELLDSIVKLNTSGNAVTQEQVQLITDYRSVADKLNVLKNKLGNGGALSDSQRKELVTIAQQTFKTYKAGYQPVYNQVTKQLTEAGIPKAFWTIPDLNSLAAAGSNQPSQNSAAPSDINSILDKYGIKY